MSDTPSVIPRDLTIATGSRFTVTLPYDDAAGAPRKLGDVEHGFAVTALREVGGGHAHGSAQVFGVAHEREAAVIGNVEPLVRVGGPRVRLGDSGDEVGVARTGGGP